MGPVNLASVFLAVTCCSAVLSFEIIREKPGKDSLIKFSLPSKSKISSLAKRRVRRESKDDHPDVFNANKEEGSCNDPTYDDRRKLQTFDWLFENETKLSISLAWIGKRPTGEASSMLLLATIEVAFLFSAPSQLYESNDFGKTFRRLNAEVFDTHIRKDGGIMKSPVNPKKVILVSHGNPFFPANSHIVRTVDGGKTWTQHSVPFQVTGLLLFHPREEDWILGRGLVDGKMFLSKDFGKSWKFLQSYVRSAKWGAVAGEKVEREEKTILMTVAAGVCKSCNKGLEGLASKVAYIALLVKYYD